MLTDNEVKKQVEDSLQFKTLSDALVGIILYSETPLTVGVFGEWGSGKTSLMRLTENDLETKTDIKVKTVWFNAWKFDKAQDLRVALIHSILKEIENDKTTLQTVKDKAVDLLKRINWLGLGRTAVNIGASIASPYLAILPLLSQVLSNSKKGTDNLSKLLPAELLKEPEGKTLELISQFEDEFRKLATDFVGEEGRLVVYIDDLDRCLPEKALDILEAIKLFLNVPLTVFVIGTDVKVIENGLIQKYGDKSETFAKNYLDKIIQVPFRIPPLSKEDIIEHFIPGLAISEELKGYGFIIADACYNPRTIKRLLNNIQLQRILSTSRDISIEDIILVKLNVLEFRWKEFHSDLTDHYSRNNENLLKVIEEYEKSDDNRKAELLKNKPLLNKYISDPELLDFLNKEPSLDNVEIAPYILLQKTTSSVALADEYGGDIDKYFKIGFSSYEEGNYIKAIDYYTRVINSNSKYLQAYFNRGLACYQNKFYSRAIIDFTKTLELDNNYQAAYYQLGLFYSNTKNPEADPDLAIFNFTKALEIKPDDIMSCYNRGVAYLDNKKYEKAILDLDKTIELNPEFADGYFKRALAQLDLGHYDQSITDNTKAIEYYPQYTNAYINRGLTYAKMNIQDKALLDYSNALKISPDNDLAYNNMIILINDLLKVPEEKIEKTIVDKITSMINESGLTDIKKNNLHPLLDSLVK